MAQASTATGTGTAKTASKVTGTAKTAPKTIKAAQKALDTCLKKNKRVIITERGVYASRTVQPGQSIVLLDVAHFDPTFMEWDYANCQAELDALNKLSNQQNTQKLP